MPDPPDIRQKHGRRAEEMGMEMVLAVTQALYKSRRALRDSSFDKCLIHGKLVLKWSLEKPEVRLLIGASHKQWKDLHDVLFLAIPILESQSVAGDNESSSALMSQHYDTLMKDLERLNDILLIARNCLATTSKAQNLAGESLLDQQVLKLINLCVRVTVRGYDGEVGKREQQFANILISYKKLLVTCLQFLHNFVMKNEQRKLLLWLDLFANSKIANEYATGTLPAGAGRDHFEAKQRDAPLENTSNGSLAEVCTNIENSRDHTKSAPDTGKSKRQTDEDVKATELSTTGTSVAPRTSSTKQLAALGNLKTVDEGNLHRKEDGELRKESLKDNEPHLGEKLVVPSTMNDAPHAASQNDVLFNAVKTERGDEFEALRTPESAAITLQAAKDQLMARLNGPPEGLGSIEEQAPGPISNDEEPSGQDTTVNDEDEDLKDAEEPTDRERGLLSDIPIVLGPQDIEALPMLIQIGICGGLGGHSYGRDMQGMRCNILLAGDAGRNLLRELLIFIAAWDLQDDELYFKLMMQIMEAVLENGLMPYAYQTFADVHDIVSPAQSMIIKILTQIFRNKQGMGPTTGKAAWTAGNIHADASRRVDIYIVRYIFTIFRSSIIPETCALIYLQGQIKQGAAAPEDFPLNLWDMERVYEGVYQFLEFFAVLTESEEWKELLVKWEITSELLTLLRELDTSIPKAPLGPLPPLAAEAQAASMVQEPYSSHSTTPAPAPVAVERPFDTLSNSVSTTNNSTNGAYTLPPAPAPTTSAAAEDDQESIESADPSDFEWRNLKKLVILVLSSLVWKSPTVQEQIHKYGGVQMVMSCCNYDGHNPYIREHAIMCLRFCLEGCPLNQDVVRGLERMDGGDGSKSGRGRGTALLPGEVTGEEGFMEEEL